MSSAYVGAIDDGLQKTRAWIKAKGLTDLPEDPFKLPDDCPLWNLGLSLAQAGGIVAALRRELRGGPIAQA